MDESLKAALAAAQVLEDLGVRWFLGGSLASSVHGVPRATFNADIMADLRPQHVRSLVQKLGDEWYVDEEAILEAIRQRACINLIHFATGMKVDVFLPKLRRFDGGEFARSRKVRVSESDDAEASVCCAEDIVSAKLEWYRMGGEDSERQWNDVLGVLRLNHGKLDQELLRASAEELGVSDLLARALEQAAM
ncbi:hypothetical protein BH11VER1_BH11VER1_10360 [soil metagenome]